MSTSIKSSATFSPIEYRRSIAEMFGVLDASKQRELADRIAIVPRQIHRLASEGLIAAPAVARRQAAIGRRP